MDNIFLPLFFLLIVLGAVLEVISLFRRTGKVEFDYSISAAVSEPDMPIKIVTTITNKSILPISFLSIRETFPISTTLPKELSHEVGLSEINTKRICRIRSRSRKKMIYDASIGRRGVYSIRADSIEIGDFLGFKELQKDVSIGRQIVIYPQKLDDSKLSDALSSFQGDIVAKRYLIRDPILTAGISEYTGREPMREIHWQKTAQQGVLMVREFEYNRELSVNVLLNVSDIGYDAQAKVDLDKCCSIARTICETLLTRNISVSFFTNAHLSGKKGDDIWKCDVTPNDTQVLLETLGRATNYARSSLDHLLEFTHRATSPASISVLITYKNTKNVDETVSRFMRTLGREVQLIKAEHFLEFADNEVFEKAGAA